MKPSRGKLSFRFNSFWAKWFLLAMATGFVTGIAAIGLDYAVQFVENSTLVRFAGVQPATIRGNLDVIDSTSSEFNVWMILPIIALGGLVTGALVYFLAPEAEGAGTDAAIDAFHNQRGIISLRTVIVKLVASAVTLGTGGSGGREGPIAQISAGIGSVLGQRFRLSPHDRRILLAIGMGAGVGAIFRAPLAGAIFSAEILYRDADLEADVIIPGAVASTVAYSVFQLSIPPDQQFKPLFGDTFDYQVGTIGELIPYTFLAFAVVAFAALYVKFFATSRTLFQRLPIPRHFKPFVGAVLAACVAIAVYFTLAQNQNSLATLGSGFNFLKLAFTDLGSLSITLLIAVALAKIVTSSLTIGSGGAGGVFGPSMVIGGSVGAAVGKIFHTWMPGIVTQPSAFGIVGMAGFFAGCANAPFSTILMVTELTGNYRLLVPTLWVSSLSFIMLRNWSIYPSQVDSRMDSPAHKGDFTVDLLEGILVGDAYRETGEGVTFHEDASLDEIVHRLDSSSQRYFHVYDNEEKLVGIFSADDVRGYLYDETLWKIANASDVMTAPVITLQLTDDLNSALGEFTGLNVDELPVVDPEDPNRIVGVLRRKESIAAYNKRRLEFQKQKDEERS